MKKQYCIGILVFLMQFFSFVGWGQAPILLNTSPGDDVIDVAVNTSLVFTFDKPVRINNTAPSSANQFIRLYDADGNSIAYVRLARTTGIITTVGCSINISKTVSSTTVIITLENTLDEYADYYVTVMEGMLEATTGEDFAGFIDTDTWNFTTGSAVPTPSISTYSPTQGATGVALTGSLQLTFNQNISKGSGYLNIMNSSGDVFQTLSVSSPNVTVSGQTLTINHNAFAEDMEYYVLIDAGFVKSSSTSANFGGILGTSGWRFKTLDLAPTVSFSPVSGTNGLSLYPSITVTFSKAAYLNGTILGTSNVKNLIKSIVASDGTSLGSNDYDVSVNSSATSVGIFVRNRLNSNVTYTITLNKVQSVNGTEQSSGSQMSFSTATYNVWAGSSAHYNDWTNSANWVNGYNAAANVLITDGTTYYPVITGSVSANTLIMEPGAQLTINSGATLTVTNFEMVADNGEYGQPSFINNGTLNASNIRIRQRVSDYALDYFFASPLQQTAIVSAEGLLKRVYDPYKWQQIDLSSGLVPGQGYLSYNTTGTELIVEGTAFNSSNVGIQTIRSATSYGWHLAGNPFPSAIRWGDLQKTNLKNHFYIRLNERLSYGIFNGETGVGANLLDDQDELIPPFHAFYVQTALEQSTGALIIPTASRVHATGNYLKSTTIDPSVVVKLVAKAGNYKDETALVFKETGSLASLDSDSEKLLSTSNSVIDLFTLASNGTRVGIKLLPELSGESLVVPLGFDAPYVGTFSIGISSEKNFPSNYQVMLDDNGTLIDLTNGDYEFSVIAKGVNSTRFKLRLVPQQATAVENTSGEKIRVYPIGDKIFAKGSSLEKSTYQLFDISGKLLENGRAIILSSDGASVPFPGVYLLKIDLEGNATTYKVLRQN
ncbi:MAG: Ig-like domain-containing protein [Breznakibacter sp.]